MNALRMYTKYQKLSTIAKKTGAFKCEIKWLSKAFGIWAIHFKNSFDFFGDCRKVIDKYFKRSCFSSMIDEWHTDLALENQFPEVPKTADVTALVDESKPKTVRIQVKTGSENHTTEWRQAKVFVGTQLIYQALKPICQEWEEVGNRGRHGKWCVAEYDIPVGSEITFIAKANSRPEIKEVFVITDNVKIDVEGYTYNNDICGWIVTC